MDADYVKSVLSDCSCDEDAKRYYDVLRGGFVWTDELPGRERRSEFLGATFQLADVIAYRASLSLGQEANEKWTQAWNQLKEILPNWPGFRQERGSNRFCGGSAGP